MCVCVNQLDFRFVHLYSDASSAPKLDGRTVASEIAKVFPRCKIDVRTPFFKDLDIEKIAEPARISDTKQPFERQPTQKSNDGIVPLYDGFVLQRLLAARIPAAEGHMDHVHIIFTNILTCTFSEDDWRYHGRAVVCGTPSIISTIGIVEGPAKPKEFYLAQFGMHDVDSLKRQFAGRFIDYGDDDRITLAAAGYALQALFFFVTDGEPFCDNKDCRLFNVHWQEDLIRTQIEKPALCGKHQSIANKVNRKIGTR
jgi:hypothetical protein